LSQLLSKVTVTAREPAVLT